MTQDSKIEPLRLGNDLAKIALVALMLTALPIARATLKGVDLLPFWAAGRLVWQGHAAQAYDLTILQGIEKASGASLIFPFLNPPPFLLMFAPFSTLPYPYALAAFDLVCFAVYLSAVWPLLKGGRFLLAVFPPVILGLILGQNSLLVAGLLFWALRLLDRRPLLAGVLIGLMTIKPQLGLLIPIALTAGRHWRAFGSAAVTTLALFGAAELILPGTTQAFLANAAYSSSLVESPLLLAKLHSLYGALRLLHAPATLAWTAQALALIACVILVWKSWRGPAPTLSKGAVLAAAIPLATPYVFDYDLVLLALPLALIARSRPILAGAGYVAPALTRIIAMAVQIPLGPLLSAAVLWAVLNPSSPKAPGDQAGSPDR